MKITIKWICLRKNSYQKLSNSYCLWLYRPNAVYATRKGRPISNFDGIWDNGYPFFYLSIFLSIYIHYLSINDQLIDLFYRLIKQKVFFFHLKVIIKSKKGPPCIFWPAHRSYIRLLNQIFISEYRGHTGYILFGGKCRWKTFASVLVSVIILFYLLKVRCNLFNTCHRRNHHNHLLMLMQCVSKTFCV